MKPKEKVRTILNDRIKQYKTRKAMNWEEVASQLGIARRTINRWLDGVVPKSSAVLMMLVTSRVITLADARKIRTEWRTRAGVFYPKREK